MVCLGNDKLVLTLVIILAVDVLLMFGQVATTQVALEYDLENNQFFDFSKSFISRFDQGNYTVISNSSGVIPEASDSVSTETGNIFTDSARSIKTWFNTATGSAITGWNYLTSFLGGPTRYFTIIGAPPLFVFGFGAFWYALTLLLIILLIFNR